MNADLGTALRGRVVLPDRVLDDAVVVVSGGSIVSVGLVDGQVANVRRVPVIAPGFVDIHCHGGGGDTVTAADPDAVRRVAGHHLARGTTTMLASLVSAPPAEIRSAVSVIADVVRSGSTVIGSHLEGPFLGPGHCGAHDPALLIEPSEDIVWSWLRAGAGTVRMVTLAPELPGADMIGDLLAEAGVLVALGHTDADATVFAAALAARRTPVVTHLFNGMAPLHHRAPGPVGASLTALAGGHTYVELIADGVHVADETIALVFSVDRAGRVALVSDAMAAAGMSDGRYSLGGLDVDVVDGVARTVAAPHSISGSTAHLADVVRRCIVSAGIDPVAAVNAASRTPAELLGLADRGRIAAGLTADLVVLDDDWRVIDVMSRGVWVQR